MARKFDRKLILENGEVYECAIKPARQSDKALLNMLIAQA